MVKKKYKSKRISLHQKYKIERKVREHNRQQRRDAKKNPDSRKKLKKDPGIPNLWPLKEEFLQKIELQKAKIAEEKARQKDSRYKETQKRRSLEALVNDANKRDKEFSKKQQVTDVDEENGIGSNYWGVKEGSKKAYYREFKKIIEVADVVLEVLDARDPLGSRCIDIEKKILQKDPNKKIILVLNKIDLVPRENVTAWLKYLRNEYPTIAFKCTTQEKGKKLGQNNAISTDVAPKSLLQSSDCLGADILIQLLKNYSRNLNLKTSISVGIIGYPNVGKSSLINSLKRTKAVGVGATPGFTKVAQEILLDKNVKLIDCPGIVFTNGTNDNDIILRNAVKLEQIPDPVEPVETIMKRCSVEQLMSLYKVPTFNNVNQFLMHIAHKKGKLVKGGVPDMKASARTVLQDWNGGKIPFYTIPPEIKNVHVSSSIVSNWGKEFNIEELLSQEESSIMNNLNQDSSMHLQMAPGQSATVDEHLLNDEEMEEEEEEEEVELDDEEAMMDEEEQDEEEEDDNNMPSDKASFMTDTPNTEDLKSLLKEQKSKKQDLSDAQDAHNPQHNRNVKKQQKLFKKQLKKKSKRLSGQMSDEEPDYDKWEKQNYGSNKKTTKVANEAYDFATDYTNAANDDDDDIDLDDV